MENEFSPCCTYGLITAFPISDFQFGRPRFSKMPVGLSAIWSNSACPQFEIGNSKFEIYSDLRLFTGLLTAAFSVW
jgi:hypothetical protein